MDLREELLTDILITMQEAEEWDVNLMRNRLSFILVNYQVEKVCTALVVSDLPEKIYTYLAVKKLEGLAQGTLLNYRGLLMDFADYICKPVNCIEPMDIRSYLASFYGKIRNSTMNTKASKIRAFFAWLLAEGHIESDPSKNVKPIKTESRVRKALSIEELELLRTCCQTEREAALLEFMYSTGCRVSEVEDANIADINWEERSLYVIGKGDKERKVYFTERAKVVIQKYLGGRKDTSQALFVGHRVREGDNRLGRNSILREVTRLGLRMPKPIKVFPHLLRHTFATHAVNSGMPIQVVQQLMGHTTPSTTIIYAVINDTTTKQEYRKL